MELVVCAVILVSIAMVLNVISLKHELPPALQIFECVLVILCVIILYAILLDSIIVPLHDHHAIDDIDSILTLVRIGFCIVNYITLGMPLYSPGCPALLKEEDDCTAATSTQQCHFSFGVNWRQETPRLCGFQLPNGRRNWVLQP